jgi:hypothetical protein
LVYGVEIFDCAGNCSTEADDCGFLLVLKLPARTLNTAAMNSRSAEDLSGDGSRQLRVKKIKIEHETEQDERIR